jgi:hypothetical protein
LHAKSDENDRVDIEYANRVTFQPFGDDIKVENPHGPYTWNTVIDEWANKPTQNPIKDKWWNEFPNIVAVQNGLNTYFQQDFKMGEPKLLSKKWSMPTS